MEKRNEKMISPSGLADRLEAMARQLRDGKFETHSGSWPVPESFSAKIKIIEKKGRLQTSLKFRWPTVDHYAPPQKAAIKDWENQFKAVKKKLGRSFKALSRAAAQDELPASEVVDQYLSDSTAFEAISGEQWPEEMAIYQDHVMNMKRAVDSGRLADFQHEVRDVRSAMAACHKAFK